jgi:hypothetical protein
MASNADVSTEAATVVAAVAEGGLLFLSDPKRPSAIQILTGQPPRGSWWSHPRAQEIYDVLQVVEGHPDVLLAKLLDGKVTLVHRSLWPALLTIATARQPWQTAGLSEVARQWLAAFDEAEAAGAPIPPASRTVAKEIEARLLTFADTAHTPTGKHETRLEPWRAWAARVNQPWPAVTPTPESISAARQTLEAAAGRLAPPPPRLPWSDAKASG